MSRTVNETRARLSALRRFRPSDDPAVLAAKKDFEVAKLEQLINKADAARAHLAALQSGDQS